MLPEDRLIKPYTLLQIFASRPVDHFGYAPPTGFSEKGTGNIMRRASTLLKNFFTLLEFAMAHIIRYGMCKTRDWNSR